MLTNEQKLKEKKERNKNETNSITMQHSLQLLHEKDCNLIAPATHV